MIGVKRALLLSTADRYVALVSNFATVVIVSRILTPGEIGVSVIGMAIVGIALSLREFSSPNFLVQQQDLTRADVRGAFTAMLLITLVIAVVLVASGPLLTKYGEERLVPFLRVIAVGVVLELISIPITALMRRDMEFGKVAAINISGAMVGSGITIVLAILGFSYMSFAWAWVSIAATTGALSLCLSGRFWMFKPSVERLRDMLVFGGYNGLTAMLYRAYDAVPYLLIGRMLSPDAAAMYSRAQMICQLPDKIFLGGAIPVVLPAFAAEARQGRSLKGPYLNALGLITVLQWPVLIALAILAHPAVELILGHQWSNSAPLAQIVALASLFAFGFELNYPVLVSMGAVRDIMLRALVIFPVSAIILAIASFYGLTAVACGLLVVVPFQAFVSLQFIRRHIAVSWTEIALAVWKSAAVAATSALGPLAFVVAADFRFDISIGEAFVAGILAATGWFAGLWLTNHPLLGEILRTLEDAKVIVRWPGSATMSRRTT